MIELCPNVMLFLLDLQVHLVTFPLPLYSQTVLLFPVKQTPTATELDQGWGRFAFFAVDTTGGLSRLNVQCT